MKSTRSKLAVTAGPPACRMAATAALRRHVDPVDIAQAALFLAGPGANNITGVELRVDAGQLIQG